MKSTTYSDTYQMVTERIIAKLEAGTIPWKHFALHPLQEPRNLVSKKPYQGINRFLLSASRFGCDCWLSFKQAQELGGHVRKGERSELVVFWKFLEVEDKETAEKKQIPFLKYSHVFTVQQCDGIKVPEQTEAPTPRKTDAIAAAERIVDDMPNKPRVEFDEVSQSLLLAGRRLGTRYTSLPLHERRGILFNALSRVDAFNRSLFPAG